MHPNRRKLTFLIVFSLLYGSVTAQQQSASTSLRKILQSLEERFEITFSFLDKDISGVQVKALDDKASLAMQMAQIERQTSLVIAPLGNHYYSIVHSSISPELHGYLIDTDTQKPIEAAIVSSNKAQYISDSLGKFQMLRQEVDSSTKLVVRHIGFETVTISIKTWLESDQKEIRMISRTEQLEEVLVEKYIIAGFDKTLNGAYVMNHPKVGILPGLIEADVFQGLQILPGVSSAAESVSDMNIRGGTNDQNLILWDGVRSYQTGHFFGLISVFNPYFTDKVTLIKNGTTAALGEAVSGTIDIRTISQLKGGFKIGGGFNMLNADIETYVPLSKKIAVNLSARRSIAGLMQTPTYDQYYERAFGNINAGYQDKDSLSGAVNQFDYYDLGAKVLCQAGQKDELQLSLFHVANELSYQEKLISSAIEITKTSTLNQYQDIIGLKHTRKWNAKVKTDVFGHLTQYQLTAQNYDLPNDQLLFQENRILDRGLDLNTTYNYTKTGQINVGYQINEKGITNIDKINNPQFSRLIKEVMLSHAFFVEHQMKWLNERLHLTTGLRANIYQPLGQYRWEPRINVNYQLNPKWSCQVNAELKSQATTQIIDLQNDFLGVVKKRWVLSNQKDIPLITSQQLGVGIQYKYGGWLIGLDGYRKIVNGIITSSQAFQNQFELVRSTGSYETNGLDYLMNYQFQQMSIWTNYTISRTYNLFSELLDQRFPSNIDIRHFVNIGVTMNSRYIEWSLGMNWHTGNPYTEVDSENPVTGDRINYSSPNAAHFSEYFRLDASAKYKFQIKGARGQLGLSLWNLSNHENTVNAYFVRNDQNVPIRVDQKGLGFTPNINFRLEL